MRRVDPLRRLLAVLSAEAEAIRSADFAHLDRIIAEKDSLCAELLRRKPGPRADMLDRLRQQAERNATLLKAALQGLRDAQARIATLAQGAAALRTYDAAGAAQPATGRAVSLERRA